MRHEFADRYLMDRVNTATPAELTGMVFDVGVTSLKAAEAAITNRQPADTHRHLMKAQDAVFELRCSLRPDAGELIGHLDNLYEYLYRRIVDANVKKDSAIVAECLAILEPLRAAWREACLGRVPAAVA